MPITVRLAELYDKRAAAAAEVRMIMAEGNSVSDEIKAQLVEGDALFGIRHQPSHRLAVFFRGTDDLVHRQPVLSLAMGSGLV